MRVLVTGASGFLGHGVVRAALAAGHEARCLLRPTSDTSRIDGLAWERATGDMLDPASLARAMRGAGGVVHLAGISDWMEIDSPEMIRTTVEGTRNVLAAARAEGLHVRVVYVSSISAVNGTLEPVVQDESTPCTLPLDEPAFVFVRAKLAAEAVCLEAARAGQPVVIVNPPETYGPNDTALITSRNLINLWKSRPALVSKGGVLIGYLDDVARAMILALEKGRPGERYILGGENRTIPDIARTMFRMLGARRRVVEGPRWLAFLFTRVMTALRIPLPYNPLIVPYAVRYWWFDTSKARRELGAEFRGLEAALEPTLAWLRSTGRLEGLS